MIILNSGSPEKSRGYQEIRLAISLAFSILGHFCILSFGLSPALITKHHLHNDSTLALQIHLNTNSEPEQPILLVKEQKDKPRNSDFSSNQQHKILSKSNNSEVFDQQEKLIKDHAESSQTANQPPTASDKLRHSEYRLVGLDPPPKPLHDIDPLYPPEAGSREGTVAIQLLINERGMVDNVVVINSFPKGMFDDSAIQAFKSAHFSPGLFLGIPVKSQLIIEVEFMPINRGASIAGRSY